MHTEQPLLSKELIRQLENEIPTLTLEIRALYQKLDQKLNLKGALVPITFGFETETLGSYTPAGEGREEQFHFSLLFAGYMDAVKITREDRTDLFLHEYAHYMQYNMEIPKEHTWKPGKHGSAWKYCCSLIGAAPSEYYRFNKGREKHDYEKELRNPWSDPNAALRDIRRREREYQNSRNSTVRFSVGDVITHPDFGEGTVTDVTRLESSVRLTIQFADRIRKIDQKWLLRSAYKKPQ
jgi:hypothetical protein